jgi:peptidoglycan-N-acetylglucosamine deacetylase
MNAPHLCVLGLFALLAGLACVPESVVTPGASEEATPDPFPDQDWTITPPSLEPSDPVPEPTLVLTFDDHFMDQWFAYLPLIESYDARVTFFVTRWDLISPEHVAGLRQAEERGHEVGHHGLLHRNPTDYLADHTLDEYIADEIVPATELMAADGFFPTAFAYPWGGQTAALDDALGEHFEILRGSGRLSSPDRILHHWDGQSVIQGGRLDTGYAPLDELVAAMDRAVAEDAALVVYAHRIFDEGDGSHITPSELEQVLALATERGMAFCTVSDLTTPRTAP